MSRDDFLPYGRHYVESDDIAAVAEVLRSDWLTTGPFVQQFENAFARRVGSAHAVACASGTGALHLSALALGLGKGDRVVVPAVTFPATANAARSVGAEVVFADVSADTGLLTPGTFEEALRRGGDRVRAVFPVHLNGQTVDMVAISALARERGIRVVEDACHAIGSLYGPAGPAVGSCRWSDLTCFSLHPVKTITAGEGGVVTAANSVLAERVTRLRTHGITRNPDVFINDKLAFAPDGSVNPWYYEMAEPGFNYRISDIHCALALSQLGKLDRFVARRAELVSLYDRALAGLAPLVHPVARAPGCVPAWHLYATQIDFDRLGMSRAEVMNRLHAQGIGTQVHYIPVYEHPYYRRRYGIMELPGANCYYARQLTLPLFVGMQDSDVERVATALRAIVSSRR